MKSFKSIVIPVLLIECIILFSCNQNWYHSDNNSETTSGNTNPSRNEAGKCYAKCIIPNTYSEESHHFYEYTGSDFDHPEVDEITLKIEPDKSEWVKKKANDCLSANPDDCMVWCLVKSPAQYVNLFIVTDTSEIKNFRPTEITQTVLHKKGGYTEWREVICNSDLTPILIRKMKTRLEELDYIMDIDSKTFNKEEKSELTRFQKDRQLPRGQIDTETISALGIKID